MTILEKLSNGREDPALHGIIKVAVMAVGGQGGGVLTNWIEDLARSQGYHCQATSVAGVAQRTGATIYYIEMAPGNIKTPVFSLSPSAGDVDVLIAAELAEAGRAIMRGFVTPDRTTLIASTHRALAVSEKTVPGNGISSSNEISAAAEIAAQKLILANMEAAAVSAGSVISSSLFGALAASGALPFTQSAFEDAIRKSGKGVEASLRAFSAGFDLALNGDQTENSPPTERSAAESVTGPEHLLSAWRNLNDRIEKLPRPVQELVRAGLQKVVDFQDVEYGASYLDRITTFAERDSEEQGYQLTLAAAKYIANALAYDDVIRVADIKTRPDRFEHIRSEMRIADDNKIEVTEYLHPRAEEIIGLLPAGLGQRLDRDEKWPARIDRWFNKGRRIRSDKFFGFLMLHILGGLKSWRLKTYRHSVELAHIDRWLETASRHLPHRYDIAVEVLKCRRLIKGYSDTHTRGLGKFDRVLSAVRLVEDRQDGAQWIARLREAALLDEDGKALTGAIKTIESFAEERPKAIA